MATINPYAPDPRVDPPVFLGVAWGGVALTALFLIARGYARISCFKKLFWDDAFVVAAWLMFVASTIIWQYRVQWMYETELVSVGLMMPDFLTLPGHMEAYLRASLAVLMMFYTSLYFIKFSFLLFFRKLGDKVKGQNVHWWMVTVITASAWIASLGTPDFRCLAGSFTDILANCTTPESVSFDKITIDYNMAMDVITDALVMSIPISIFWKVKISPKQKLALLSIFSLTILTMIFAIVRVAVVSAYSAQPDQLWIYMWTSIEQTVAIMVACLASFRVFFTKSGTPQKTGYTKYSGGTTLRNLWAGPKSWFRSTSSGSTVGASTLPTQRQPPVTRNSDDTEHKMVSLTDIHVSKTFTATLAPYNGKTIVHGHEVF